MEKYDKAGQNI